MDNRSLIATCAALVLAACAGTPPAPAAQPASTPTIASVEAPTKVAAAASQPSEMPVFVEEVDTPATNQYVTCKEQAPTGTRLPAIMCTLVENENDPSPGASHQVYIRSR